MQYNRCKPSVNPKNVGILEFQVYIYALNSYIHFKYFSCLQLTILRLYVPVLFFP